MILLECNELVKDFGGLVAISKVSFNVEKGEILGLIGPNGAGKTTLFNLITGIYPPSSGRIRFKGEDIVGLKPHDICRRGISRTFQSVRPFLNQTVFQNVLTGVLFGGHNPQGKAGSARSKALEVIEVVGLTPKKDVVTKEMTVQDRKRVEIGRALATGAELLLLDEPMAGLTAADMKQIMSLIRRINESGITLMVVEHVMKAVMNISTRMVVLHHGEKIFDGAPGAAAKDRKVIEVYLGETYAAA